MYIYSYSLVKIQKYKGKLSNYDNSFFQRKLSSYMYYMYTLEKNCRCNNLISVLQFHQIHAVIMENVYFQFQQYMWNPQGSADLYKLYQGIHRNQMWIVSSHVETLTMIHIPTRMHTSHCHSKAAVVLLLY